MPAITQSHVIIRISSLYSNNNNNINNNNNNNNNYGLLMTFL